MITDTGSLLPFLLVGCTTVISVNLPMVSHSPDLHGCYGNHSLFSITTLGLVVDFIGELDVIDYDTGFPYTAVHLSVFSQLGAPCRLLVRTAHLRNSLDIGV